MRGKQGNAARNRRERAELEQRAETAERRAERLEKELAELRETSTRQIALLRTEASALRRERDQGLSPAFKREHELTHRLTSELRAAKSDLEDWKQTYRKVIGQLFAEIKNRCVSPEQEAAMASAIQRANRGMRLEGERSVAAEADVLRRVREQYT